MRDRMKPIALEEPALSYFTTTASKEPVKVVVRGAYERHDVLWVQEPWQVRRFEEPEWPEFIWKTDLGAFQFEDGHRSNIYYLPSDTQVESWNPPQRMPDWAARTYLFVLEQCRVFQDDSWVSELIVSPLHLPWYGCADERSTASLSIY